VSKLSYRRALSIFKSLKAKGAEDWARMEADGEAYLARFLFMQGAARCVIDEDETWLEGYDKDYPISGAIDRILKKGIDPRDLTDVVRDAQWDVLYNLLTLLENGDHGIEDLQERVPVVADWRLCEIDADERPTGRLLQALHEDIGDFDPTGRGGAPPRRAKLGGPRKRKARARNRQ
jgi:hypothetical protein